MEMFRGLSVSWSERAAVWPVKERGVPAAGWLIASNEKNGENKMRKKESKKANQTSIIKTQDNNLEGGTY